MSTTDLRKITLDDDADGTEYYDADEVIMPPDEDDDEPEAATAAEKEAKRELVQGELAGRPIYVPPTKQWRASAMHALRQGDFETWAEITLDDDDWDTWQEIDPTLAQIEDFFEIINPKLSSGNSRASRRSSRSTRRR